MKYKNLKDVFFDSSFHVGIGLSTYDDNLDKELFNYLPTISTIADSEVAMNAIADSKVAMNAIVDSEVAMNAIFDSEVAMNAIADSKVAMNAIADSEVAMNAIFDSEVAMNAIFDSEVAMNAIADSEVAMNAIFDSEVAMNAIFDSEVAMNAIFDSEVAMNAIVDSEIAMNAIFNNLKAKKIMFGKDVVTKAISNNKNSIEWLIKNKAVEKKFTDISSANHTKIYFGNCLLLQTYSDYSDKGYLRTLIGTYGKLNSSVPSKSKLWENVVGMYSNLEVKGSSGNNNHLIYRYVPMDK